MRVAANGLTKEHPPAANCGNDFGEWHARRLTGHTRKERKNNMYYTIWFIRDNLIGTIRCHEDSLREKIDYIRQNGGKVIRVRDMCGEDFTDY